MAQRKRLRALAGRRAIAALAGPLGHKVQRNASSAWDVEVPLAEPDSFRACDLCR